MRNKIKTFIQTPLLLLIGSLLLIQCSKSDTVVVQPDNLDVTLGKTADLSIFKAAIKQAKLENFTQGPGPFTLLAPTDAAFNAAGITLSGLASIDSITLTALVLNHFQSSAAGVFTARTSYEIPEGPNGPMAAIGGFSNYSYKDKAANKIYINGASVIERDIKCSNGIIHKLDKVLLPSSTSIITLLTANSNYSLMVQAISKAGLTATISPATTSPVTVFALSNAIMTANGYDAVTIAALSGASLTTLTNILKYHVVNLRNFSTDVKTGNLKTIFGTNVVISRNNGVFVKGTNNASPFQITPVDLAASNGVIHAIAGMLKP